MSCKKHNYDAFVSESIFFDSHNYPFSKLLIFLQETAVSFIFLMTTFLYEFYDLLVDFFDKMRLYRPLSKIEIDRGSLIFINYYPCINQALL